MFALSSTTNDPAECGCIVKPPVQLLQGCKMHCMNEVTEGRLAPQLWAWILPHRQLDALSTFRIRQGAKLHHMA